MDADFLKYRFQDGYDGVITKTKFQLGVRHVQVLYMFLCSVVLGAVRGCVGVELLALADPSRRNDTYIQIHDWNSRVQGTILSSFFFGYALVLLPAELQLKRLGDKFVITSVLLINGALSAAMPTIVNRGGWAAACTAQAARGATQACAPSAARALLARWLPPAERRPAARCIDSGLYLGLIVALPLAGMLSESRLGWELLFYTQAMMTLSMAAMWGLLTSSSPDRHQPVGDFEKEFIKEASAGYRPKNLQRPWRSILGSRRVWAAACAHAAANALFTFYLVELPFYIKSMGFSLRESAQLAMIPFAVLWLVYTTVTPCVKWITKTGLLAYFFNLTYLRKLINALGAGSIVIGLTVLPNTEAGGPYLRFSILIGIFGLLGLQYSDFLENLRDLTENHTGLLFTVSSTIASAVGATVPIITGLILNAAEEPQRWRVVFSCMGGAYGAGGAARAWLARGDTDQSELVEVNQRKTFAELEDETAV